jgi:hypothetical protein
MRKVAALVCLTAMLSLAGCGGFGGLGPAGHGTSVTLHSKNFTVLKSNVKGEATVMVLFPMNIPFLGPGGLPLGEADLYHKAIAQLKKNAGGDGDNTGYVNLTVDTKLKSFVVVGWVTVTVTADVVKFTN